MLLTGFLGAEPSRQCRTLPFARGVAVALAVVVAMRGERRVPLRGLGEALEGAFFEAAFRRRLFPSFLGVLRMLKAIDWRRSACWKGLSDWGHHWPHSCSRAQLAGPLQAAPRTAAAPLRPWPDCEHTSDPCGLLPGASVWLSFVSRCIWLFLCIFLFGSVSLSPVSLLCPSLSGSPCLFK